MQTSPNNPPAAPLRRGLAAWKGIKWTFRAALSLLLESFTDTPTALYRADRIGTMPLMPHRRTDERSAHETVSADAATNLWERDAVDWPVSGDETGRYQGRRAIRQATIDLWHAPGVMPKIQTAGIRVGAVIDTWQGRLTVTRVGSIAGFGTDESGREVRWEIESVMAINPA